MEVTDVDEAIISVCYSFLDSGIDYATIRYVLNERGVDQKTILNCKELSSTEIIGLLSIFY